jgi:hypothetical protein
MQDEFIDDQPPVGTLTPEARESLRLAIADTPSDHPDRAGHTPGPWPLQDVGYGIRIGDIAWVGFGSAHSNEEHQANARLIAASPRMFRALLAIRDAMRKGPDFEVPNSDRNHASVLVNAAIAEATGKDTP